MIELTIQDSNERILINLSFVIAVRKERSNSKLKILDKKAYLHVKESYVNVKLMIQNNS